MEVGLDHGVPVVPGEVGERHRRPADAGVVEEQVHAAGRAGHAREERGDGFGRADVGRQRQRARAAGRRLAQGVLAPARERDLPARVEQGMRDRAPDARAGAGDDGDRRAHGPIVGAPSTGSSTE